MIPLSSFRFDIANAVYPNASTGAPSLIGWKAFIDQLQNATQLVTFPLKVSQRVLDSYDGYGESTFLNEQKVVYINSGIGTSFCAQTRLLTVRGPRAVVHDIATNAQEEIGEFKFQTKMVRTDGKTVVVKSNDAKHLILKKTLGVDASFVPVDIGDRQIESIDIKVFGNTIVAAIQAKPKPTWYYNSSIVVYAMDTKTHHTCNLGNGIIQDMYQDANGALFLSLDTYNPLGYQIVKIVDAKPQVLHTTQNHFGKFLSVEEERIVTFDINPIHSCFRRLQILYKNTNAEDVTTFSGLDHESKVIGAQLVSHDRAALFVEQEGYPEETNMHIIDIHTGHTIWKQRISDRKLWNPRLDNATGRIVATDYRNTYLFSFAQWDN